MTDNLLRQSGWKFEGPTKSAVLLDDYVKWIIIDDMATLYPPSHYDGDPTETLSIEGEK
jgi:hypothetical protein